VDEALDLIAHRGPDGRGVLEAPGDVLHGHVRLAIMDPTPRSDQPFVYNDVTLSYVGELWNYAELRDELRSMGYVFRTTGDTEVVAAMLQSGGSDALPLMHGQFALAWTDGRTGRTTLARDRWGEVPLYVHETLGSLLEPPSIRWASERKAFGLRGSEAAAVPAGCTWEVTRQPRVYYDPNVCLQRNGHRGDPDEIRALLEQGVARRLQSDVPVCCLLSGGVDSTSILALARRHQPDIVAYTIVFDEQGPDLLQARRVASEMGVELREVPVPDPSDASLRQAIEAIEITMKAQIEIALHCLPLAERIYADGFRVVLSGEGSDEIFGGYAQLQYHSKHDWQGVRLSAVRKMARGNFVRINKAFMAHGIEARTPFMDRELVEAVIPLTREECFERKKLLRDAMVGHIPEVARKREKASFQVASGMRAHMTERHEDKQQVEYNRVARELFGGLPRD
jgi:asparagine synthase (glutamine-hydrolysing)